MVSASSPYIICHGQLWKTQADSDKLRKSLSSGTWEAQSCGIAKTVGSQNLGMPGVLDPQDRCP